MKVHHHPTATGSHPDSSEKHTPSTGSERRKWLHYFWEFLLIFLAVFCGFVAENYRENLSNKQKEVHYIRNMISDLKSDTAEINMIYLYHDRSINDLEQLSKIPVEELKDLKKQGLFFHHFIFPGTFLNFFVQRNNTISQLKSGGFNIMKNENVIDSINQLYSFYSGIDHNNDALKKVSDDISTCGRQMLKIPEVPVYPDDPIFTVISQNKEVFIRYDKPMMYQLYNLIGLFKANFINYRWFITEYKAMATRLIIYLKREYHLE